MVLSALARDSLLPRLVRCVNHILILGFTPCAGTACVHSFAYVVLSATGVAVGLAIDLDWFALHFVLTNNTIHLDDAGLMTELFQRGAPEPLRNKESPDLRAETGPATKNSATTAAKNTTRPIGFEINPTIRS